VRQAVEHIADFGDQVSVIGAAELRVPGQDCGVIRREFRSEVEAFFPVGVAGSEFAAYRKISAPGAASPGQGDMG
jgi:hypothetical protein